MKPSPDQMCERFWTLPNRHRAHTEGAVPAPFAPASFCRHLGMAAGRSKIPFISPAVAFLVTAQCRKKGVSNVPLGFASEIGRSR
jgi:hypothetical protein